MPGPRPKYAITLTPAQEARVQQLSTCDMAPFAAVQRADRVAAYVPLVQNPRSPVQVRLPCHRC